MTMTYGHKHDFLATFLHKSKKHDCVNVLHKSSKLLPENPARDHDSLTVTNWKIRFVTKIHCHEPKNLIHDREPWSQTGKSS